MSEETIGASSYSRMRRQRRVAAAVRTTSLTASTVTGRSCQQTRSTTEPLGTGTFMASAERRPRSSGRRPTMTSPALVSCGMMFSAAPPAPRVLGGDVGQPLLVGVGVDGGQEGAADAEGVGEDLQDRRRAVGGAGGVRDDAVLRLEVGVVHPHDHGD